MKTRLILLILAVVGCTDAFAASIIVTTPADMTFNRLQVSALASTTLTQDLQVSSAEPFSVYASVGWGEAWASMSRITDGVTFGASGVVKATQAGYYLFHCEAKARDIWQFTLDGSAEFFFDGVINAAPISPPKDPIYFFALFRRTTEVGVLPVQGDELLRISSSNKDPLSATLTLDAGTYWLEASVYQHSPNNDLQTATTNWSYRAGIPEPSATLLGLSAAVMVFARRKRS